MDTEFEEKELRKLMDAQVAKVLRGKRLVALRKVLIRIGYPDATGLFRDLVGGMPVLGLLPETGAFPQRRKMLLSQLMLS